MWALREIFRYSKSFFSSILCENIGNAVRAAVRDTVNNAIKEKGVWYTAALGSNVLADHGRPAPMITNCARNIAPRRLVSGLFKKTDDDEDEDPDMLDPRIVSGVTEENPCWQRSPDNIKKAAIATGAMLLTGGDWNRLKKVWRSNMMMVGTVAAQISVKRACLVVYVSSRGFLGWHLNVVKSNVGYLGELSLDPDSGLKVHIVENENDWLVNWPTILTPNADTAAEDTTRGKSLVMMTRCLGVKPPQLAAKRGFSNFNVKELEHFFAEMQVPYPRGKKPKGEVALTTALMQFYLKEAATREAYLACV